MNILIVGSQGQLGKSLKDICVDSINNYIFTDIINENIILDICNYHSLYNFIIENNIEYIINCAAYTNVENSESTNKEDCYKINCVGPENIAKICKENNIKFIHISTDYVYDGETNIPYIENNQTNPQSYYGKCKLQGENNVLLNNPNNSIIIRTSWLYSEYRSNFVKTMINLGYNKNSISVIFDQIGTPTYSRDLANTIYNIIHNEFYPGVYHYSNEGICSWYDFAKEIFNILNINCNIIPIHSTEYNTIVKRPYYSVLDKTKIKNKYNIKIPYWKDSLKKCLLNIKNEK